MPTASSASGSTGDPLQLLVLTGEAVGSDDRVFKVRCSSRLLPQNYLYRGLGWEDWDHAIIEIAEARGTRTAQNYQDAAGDALVQQWRLFRVGNDFDNDASRPVRDIQVCCDIVRHHDLYPDNELDCLRKALAFSSSISCAALCKCITLAQGQRPGFDVAIRAADQQPLTILGAGLP